MFPNRVPMESEASSQETIYMSESPVRSPPTKKGDNIWSPSTGPHVDRRPTYNGMRSGSPRGSFMTLQSLPQCHAAFSMIPSTLAWVDQSPVSQQMLLPPPPGYALHNCYRLPRDPGYSRVRIHDNLRYGQGVGFMGGRSGSCPLDVKCLYSRQGCVNEIQHFNVSQQSFL
jgi:hypothetical protein